MSRYRSLQVRSNVDENLFGSTRGSQVIANKQKVKASPLQAAGVVISQSELQRLMENASIKSEAESNAEKEALQRQREDRERKAKERKDRMRKLGEVSALKSIRSDAQVEDDAKKQAIAALAADMLDKNHDVTKLLESMSARAVAFTLRDKQLEEKAREKDADAEYNRRMDMMMEIDRLKELKQREEEEALKRSKRVEDMKVITEQIEYRQRAKIIAAEAREQENYAMREVMKKYQEEDERIRQAHLQEVERSRVEFLEANAEAIRRKREAKEQEKKEVCDILIYQAMKDAEMAKREELEAEVERKKKERQAQLLAQQERVQSNAGKIDELRARRAEEERERKARQRELEEAAKRKRDMAVLVDARIQQANEKQARKEREAALWKEQYLHDTEYNLRMQQREEEESRAKMMKAVEHRNNLIQTIEQRKAAKQEHRSDVGDEGIRYRQERLAEVSKLAAIRDKMVRDLEHRGVNPKYLAEMKAVDIAKMVNR